ncbi:phage baseplate assembly protein V [Paraburkholderia acidiphila]|uniref:Phage baseplate assembly protein V n=1 Tax=Paraburkholderia acidiphila TaxID=2571747 RepID=A0A7Z2G7Q3_9BURK|nr:phage baseplate assembly protein V [Paraburkholderia acidiphila]QGZ56758.1 phage baseplate assembly protein V [Paraburkholderia acidiphila]
MSKSFMDRAARRILNIIGRARVNLVKDSGPVQMAQLTVNDLETIDNIPIVHDFGFSSNPPAGSDVAMVFVGGDRSNGVIVASNHQKYRVRNLAPGESVIYTQDGKQIYLTASGGIKIAANGQPVEVDNATTVTINASTKVRMVTPRLECTGDIVDNCDTTGRSMAADRVIYDGHTHAVPNVQLGGPGTNTNAPNQTE